MVVNVTHHRWSRQCGSRLLSVIALAALVVSCKSPDFEIAEEHAVETGQLTHVNSRDVSESFITQDEGYATSGELIGSRYDATLVVNDRYEMSALRTVPISETARRIEHTPTASSAGRPTW